MFERYTETARRVIFFARFEASQYGSFVIDAEHILLGLLREDRALMHRVGLIQSGTAIRDDIEKVIKRGERIPTSVELPLSTESKKILNIAGEEAERLGHKHVGTEHILLGILRLPGSLAGKLLIARGAKPNFIREQIALRPALVDARVQPASGALSALADLLDLLKTGPAKQVAALFHEKGQFVDSSGKRWASRTEIEKGAETLFAPFAKRNVSLLTEGATNYSSEMFVASVLWEFAASSDRSKSLFRMSIVLASTGEEWAIVLAQMTPLALGCMSER
jgi:Clp amino terminal domain, pathogenicity island component